MKVRDSASWLVTLLPYLVLVLLHVALAWHVEQPYLCYDELGYLGNAWYLAGVGPIPTLPGKPVLYHWGYSLLLVPVFWLFPEPLLAFRAVLTINAALLSLLYYPLYYLLQRHFGSTRRLAIGIAFGTCLYPPFVLQSNVAWSENAFIPFYALLVMAFAALRDKKSYLAAVAFGLLAGFLYTIHPRALSILPISVVYFAVLAWTETLPKGAVVTSIAVMTAVFLLTRLVNAQILAAGWSETSAASILAKVFSTTGVENLLPEAAGQPLYLSQATYGLWWIGLLYVRQCLVVRAGLTFRGLLGDTQGSLLLFLLLTSAGLFFTSCASMLEPARTDTVIYGRYNEGFLGLYISLALRGLHSKGGEGLHGISRSCLVIAVTFGLNLLVMDGRGDKILSRPVNGINILGVWPVIHELGRARIGSILYTVRQMDIGAITVTSLLLFLVIRYVFLRDFWAGMILLMTAFSAVTAYNYYFPPLGDQTSLRRYTALVSPVRGLGKITRISYDMSASPMCLLSRYQFMLPNVRFELFYSQEGQMPRTPVVISGRRWQDAERLNASLLASDLQTDRALWALPGRARDRQPP